MKEVLNVKSFHFHCSVKTSAGKMLCVCLFLFLGWGGLFQFSVGDHTITSINN